MSCTWIEHKGKKILYTQYSKSSNEENLKLITEQSDIVKQCSGKVLLLDDFRDAFVNEEFMKMAKELGKSVLGPKTEKNAILGVTGIKKVLLKAYNAFTKYPVIPFNTKEEALDFLTED